MSSKSILGIFLAVLGEALLVTAFLLLGVNMADDVLWLDIVVSSLIFALFCYNAIAPWVKLDSGEQREVSQLGINWAGSWIYAILAVVVMVWGYYQPLAFALQIILQGILALALFGMFLASLHAGDKTAEVYHQERALRADVNGMRNAMRTLLQTAMINGKVDPETMREMESLNEDARYASPVNTPEGEDLARQFMQAADNVRGILAIGGNGADLSRQMMQLRIILDNYKNAYSM